MIPESLLDYIQTCLNRGTSAEAIKAVCIYEGWDPQMVESAVRVVQAGDTRGRYAGSYTPPPSKILSKDPYTETQGEKTGRYVEAILSGKRRFRVLLISLGLAFLSAIYPSYKTIKAGLPFIDKLQTNITAAVKEVIPEELTITIKDGKASTNMTEPVYLTISGSTLEKFETKSDSDNGAQARHRLLAIDTKGNVENFEQYQSSALLTASSLVSYSNEDLKIYPLSRVPDMQISQMEVLKKMLEINKNSRVTNYLRAGVYASPLILTLTEWLGLIFNMLEITIVLWIINKIHQKKIRFSRLFAVAGLFSLPVLAAANISINFLPAAPVLMLINTYEILVICVMYLFISKYSSGDNPV
ncbi:MAG: hypothetical protein UX91_C0006G0190 [Candidatus Amesbacteria bacterium GW2011_GWB1_47_19]|nr:MAG: hypothetical protein UW51_C0002G0191 [Candidatus Amesbacteria bacterium GW2011_GWA1_44_24]KKU31218.1 MAG: hypothetical protein UX46_C0006G0010 [Candidatus Amesbacteria bacterium GW2011_GWC1_46_24]KKU67128.1 MAG: hypothetical protein UX91_C0006G0190 [Candidatus Amesbacteria bacterium GW2011_GWB1_47_19]OGD05484.1 MAG: hypothetical protein A2379_00810 [Candidatus Amesbacteria bacterium RIFOXYB1_FULL_47_13]HBC72998.1 hypothetical protein [Candidatus Amesbacteria bacterium]